jgi:hypothetical protein
MLALEIPELNQFLNPAQTLTLLWEFKKLLVPEISPRILTEPDFGV